MRRPLDTLPRAHDPFTNTLAATLQRIAGSLGLSPGAVDGRLTRTLRKLQSKAEQLDD